LLDVFMRSSDNKSVKTEQFLHFWSLHNATIIEVLIGLILCSFIYLAFRTFFTDEVESESATSSQLNSVDIEKTLQKLIESQAGQRVGFVEGKSDGSGASTTGATGTAQTAAGASAVSVEEVKKFTQQIEEKEKVVVELKKQLEETQKAQAEAKASSPDLDKKLKDLEARLAEYEIISEDIADLSFYKEENAKLQKELAGLKAGGAAAASPSAGAAKVVSADASGGALDAAAVAAAASAAAPASPAAPAVENSAIDSALANQPAKPAEGAVNSSIDDELMKEFAAAVQDQKGATAAPAEKVVIADEKKLEENQNLMGEFESFVKKS